MNMLKIKKILIDKLAHLGAGNLFAVSVIVFMTLLGFNAIIINVVAFVGGILLGFFVEFKDQEEGRSGDMYDALATALGSLMVLLMYNF